MPEACSADLTPRKALWSLRCHDQGATLFFMRAPRVTRSTRVATHPVAILVALVVMTSFGAIGWGQTSMPGPAVDLEVVNPSDRTNLFCVGPDETLTARLFIRPGTATTSCTPSCGTAVDGGAANLATAVADIAFDAEKLTFTSAINNPLTAAVDGLVQDNSAQGRIGWALAGDWTPNGDTSGTLATPCDMQLLDSADWVVEINFSVLPSASGITSFRLRRETDPDSFSLSFADICGSEALTKANGGVDEIIDGIVLISSSCADVLFFDGFESGATDLWTSGAKSK